MANKLMKKAIALGKLQEQLPKYKQVPCIACNGSGHYDNTGSPKCGSCYGTGKVRVKN